MLQDVRHDDHIEPPLDCPGLQQFREGAVMQLVYAHPSMIGRRGQLNGLIFAKREGGARGEGEFARGATDFQDPSARRREWREEGDLSVESRRARAQGAHGGSRVGVFRLANPPPMETRTAIRSLAGRRSDRFADYGSTYRTREPTLRRLDLVHGFAPAPRR